MRELRGRGTEVLTFAADFEQLDDGRVLVLGHGKLQRDLGPLEQELGWIWELGEDGRITAMTNYLSQAEARRAAGADGE